MRYSLLIIAASIALFWGLVVLGKTGKAAPDSPTLVFWTYKSSGSVDNTVRFWNTVARRFERRNPQTKVRIIADIDQGNYVQVLGSRVVGGNPPDVLIIDGWMCPLLNRDGVLMPLERFIAGDTAYHTDDFPPGMVDETYVGGVRYAVPWYGGYPILLYRTDLFAQAGAQPPRTWDDLVAAGKLLREKAGLAFPFAMPLHAYMVQNFIWQARGSILSPDQRTIQVCSDPAVQGMQFIHDLIYRYKLMDPGIAKGTQANSLWSSGAAAMLVDGSWALGTLDQSYPQWKGKWSAIPLPAGRVQACSYGGQDLVMTKKTRHPALAWKFMSLATSPEMQELWSDIVGAPPANLRTMDAASFRANHPDFARMKSVMLTGVGGLCPFFGEIWYGRFQNVAIDKVMPDPDADIKKAVCESARQMQAVVDLYWKNNPYFVQGRVHE
jgi:N,N'-diacetylchitobiose transport system substrate-binding protein